MNMKIKCQLHRGYLKCSNEKGNQNNTRRDGMSEGDLRTSRVINKDWSVFK